MKTYFSSPLRIIALLTALIFGFNQVVFAVSANPYEQYQTTPVQPSTDASTASAVSPQPQTQALSSTTLDFMAGQNSPLSASTQETVQSDPNKTYDSGGKLRKEISQSGTAILHVYEGEEIQTVIDQAQAGDTVYLHAGTYHEHVVLKTGVNLTGESKDTTILNGDYEEAKDVEDLESMKRYSSQLVRINDEIIQESKDLLEAMGISVVQAPGEGEAQAHNRTKKEGNQHNPHQIQ